MEDSSGEGYEEFEVKCKIYTTWQNKPNNIKQPLTAIFQDHLVTLRGSGAGYSEAG